MAEHYKGLATFKATEDSRRLTLPQAPEAYEIKNTKDFQAPQGVEFKINANDPMVAGVRQWAHKNGISQGAVEEIIDIYAGGQIGTTQSLKTARDAEITKLGAAGPARVTAVQDFLGAQLGDELGKTVGNMLITARHVEGFEKLMANFRGQGSGYTPPRAPNEPAKLSDADVSKMTYSERKDYAAKFSNGAAH